LTHWYQIGTFAVEIQKTNCAAQAVFSLEAILTYSKKAMAETANPIQQPQFLPRALSIAIASLFVATPVWAQTTTPDELDKVVVTGTRIRSANITSTSPVTQLGADEIKTMRAVTVEDFSTKLPQFAGGVSSTSVGSDAFGAQTLDLRGLGQSRTLVLINGTRAVPFSFRNAVDVNFVPAPLLRRVDVLTGGAAAVYGADAIAGVVNFIVNDNFRGLQASGNYRSGSGGGSQAGLNLTGGTALGSRGSVVGYLELTDRKELLAGERTWALDRPTLLAPNGGTYTDVVSGNKFSIDPAGQVTGATLTTDYTPKYFLVQPLQRLNASAFFKYDLTDSIQGYGRYMFSNVKTTGAPRSGQAPVVVTGNYSISATNPFLTNDIRSRLTFVNGAANVTFNRSLGELGVLKADNDRATQQLQFGVRGAVTEAINWDVYAQFGRSAESILVKGDGLRSKLPGLINSVNWFGSNADLSGLAQDFKYGDRTRVQNVFAATLSGDSSGFFKLPAGPIGFAAGVEARRERATFDYNPDLATSFRQGTESGPPVPPFFNANEIYTEALVPILANAPFAKSLTFEAAYRRSSYKKSVGESNSYPTNKIGLSWAPIEDVRLRATAQTVIREPNFGEFANPVGSIPFSSLVSVARLRPRYQGDPCVLGTGNAEQCARFKAPAVGSYNSLDAANLTGGYFFGGNPDIRAEKGKTRTFGFVVTPKALQGFNFSLDAYKIVLNDAVGQIQPVDALTSCYITDPTANNPLCAAVTRDPATGRIKDGFPVDRNLASIKQSGFDVDFGYRIALSGGYVKQVALGYQASIVQKYTIQRNAVLDPIDCKGTFGSRCSSDATSLVSPAYRHRATAGLQFGEFSSQLAWKRIGEVKDSAVGGTEVIKAQDYFDLNFSYDPQFVKGLKLNLGIDNITNKKPPSVTASGTFNTFVDTYPVVGRSFGLTGTYKF
jgi:iron complex outermembrane recepter protein